jgi:AcrR family transcriptional regulator
MKQGYHATSISEVANEAGITKGSLCKGKEELLSIVVEDLIGEV